MFKTEDKWCSDIEERWSGRLAQDVVGEGQLRGFAASANPARVLERKTSKHIVTSGYHLTLSSPALFLHPLLGPATTLAAVIIQNGSFTRSLSVGHS